MPTPDIAIPTFGVVPFAGGFAMRLARPLVVLCLLLISTPSRADAITDKFRAHAKGSTKTVDHAAWDAMLKAHLVIGADGINRLVYKRLVGLKPEIKSYIRSLESIDVATLDRPEQLSYWMNLYNAATLDAVVAKYPVKSINDVNLPDPSGQLNGGPWKAKLVTVGGMALTLDEIENKIVRPVFNDARAHYGLNCLSIGCPNLRPVALTSANLEAQLELGSKEYVNHPRAFSLIDGKVVASSVYEWFPEDFGGLPGVFEHLKRYASGPLKAKLEGVQKIDAYVYDWTLADASN